MIAFFKRLLFDEGAFLGVVRAVIAGLGGLYERLEIGGQLPGWMPPGVGIVLGMVAFFFRSSSTHAQTAQQEAVAAMTKHEPVPLAAAAVVQNAAALTPNVEVTT